MGTTDDAGPPLDLVGRSWIAFGIGVALVVVGAIILNASAGSPASILTGAGAVMAALGGMTVQASIVGFVFGSYDGTRGRRPPAGGDAGIGDSTRRPAGWYPHPDDAALVRWWDGGRWTETRPAADG